jgi:hypothetical protein
MLIPLSSSLIFTLIGVTLPIAAHAADMNKTHIYNPHWPPHAKFHNGQTLSMSLLLGGLTTFLKTDGGHSGRLPTLRQERERQHVRGAYREATR